MSKSSKHSGGVKKLDLFPQPRFVSEHFARLYFPFADASSCIALKGSYPFTGSECVWKSPFAFSKILLGPGEP